MSIDLGTGDGRLPYVLAGQEPERLFIGVDANAAGLRNISGRAARRRAANLLYVRAAVELLPAELAGVADRLTVILPWGSLLAAVARPAVPLLAGIRALCRPGAQLTVVLALDPLRDRGELDRLDVPPLDASTAARALGGGYAEAGFSLRSVAPLDTRGLAAWPSTWTRKLAFGRPRQAFLIEARADDRS